MKNLNSLQLGLIGILIIAIIFIVYFFLYQPNQRQNNLMMGLKCKDIAESRYQKAKEVNEKQFSMPTIFIEYAFNRRLNTCIYVQESSWIENDKYYFLFRVIDSVRDKLLLSGYYSDTYQKDIFRDDRKNGQEITADEYKKLKDELLNK